MRVLDPPAAPIRPAPWRTMLRLALAGAGCALLVIVAGVVAERIVFGSDAAGARARVEASVAATFERLASELQAMAAARAGPSLVRRAAGGDVAAARELFTAAEREASAQEDFDLALTVYGAGGQPIAWAGRPSELPSERLQGPEAWFLAHGALGLRLVYVRPVVDGELRVGTIATERALLPRDAQPLAPAPGLQNVVTFRLPTRLAPVSIELPYESPRTRISPDAFEVLSPTGDPLLTAVIAREDLEAGRERWRRATLSLSLLVAALAVALLTGPMLDWRRRTLSGRDYVVAVVLVAAALLAARLVARAAAPERWLDAEVVSAEVYSSARFWPLLASPLDFLLTALTAGGLVGLALLAVYDARQVVRHHRLRVTTGRRRAAFVASHLAAGAAGAAVLLGHGTLLRDTIARTTLDLLHFSLHPVNPTHVTMQMGLVIAHATALGLVVLPLLLARHWWIAPRSAWRIHGLAVVCWALPLIVWRALGPPSLAGGALAVALATAAALALLAPRLRARFRHGSQAFRLLLMTVALIVPALAFYPTVLDLSLEARMQLVQDRYALQAVGQRVTVYQQLLESLDDVDRFSGLGALIAAEPASGAVEPLRAFQVWQDTALAEYLITSSVELYGPDGSLVSRFAFNLPEDLTLAPRSVDPECQWEVMGVVAPFFAEDRRMLHAGRGICADGDSGATLGSVVVHAMLDYENLPFIASRSPYVELLRPSDPLRGEGLAGRDVQYAYYGWSGTPDYWSGDTAWSLTDAVFADVQQSREPFWTQLSRGATRYHVYVLNDRGGIYVLGFPVVTMLDHLVNLAELIVLGSGTYLLLLVLSMLYEWLGRRQTHAPALLREVRASFYRKLFLAFVLAVFLPVAALALVTRNYVADQTRANVEQEAVRTASVARRVVEDLVAPRARRENLRLDDDNLMVWVSRLIGQDVNVFTGAQLVATSERNLFASGLLPTRTPADVYHAINLRSEATTVARERIGQLEYLVAGISLAVGQFDAVLTVPLTSRQQEIESQIDTLDRRVLLGALIFILAGAGLGYTMAERIADPVNRLTRATRRIARGELDVRVAATSSDELRRLVEDFNGMATELQRQRRELERTNRLEAWAEMARQVAHDIKNPLTPIQLNAEHLRRVHADRGEPLGRVVHECVDTILAQVRLLRQIASEFSNFASSPVVRLAVLDAAELVREIVEPYRAGLEPRIGFEVHVPARLPPVRADRTLVGRALTNLIENALHAMPGTGTLTVAASGGPDGVRIRVSDTGVGMDPEALGRAFEPYFSTKATGTGLGLPIAKRNVELSGGTIAVSSIRGQGTTVELTLPLADVAPPEHETH